MHSGRFCCRARRFELTDADLQGILLRHPAGFELLLLFGGFRELGRRWSAVRRVLLDAAPRYCGGILAIRENLSRARLDFVFGGLQSSRGLLL